MATFADMMTLLLCFFVLLLSFANQDAQKFQDMLGSIQGAFGVQFQRKQDTYAAFSPTKMERKGMKLDREQRQIIALMRQIKHMINPDPDLKKKSSVAADASGVLIRVQAGAMFNKGSAALKKDAQKLLDVVIAIMKQHNYELVVRGHTDDQKVKSKAFPSNWELSAARAAAALRYILEKGKLDATKLKAVGYADTQPLVPNNSPKNRALNRRVEFYFHKPTSEGSW